MEEIKGYDLAHNEYYFSLKIIEAENKEINLVDERYKKGHINKLSLYYYGRPLLILLRNKFM